MSDGETKRVLHQQMLVQLDDIIIADDLRKLKEKLLVQYITPKDQLESDTFSKLCGILEKKGHIYLGQYDLLLKNIENVAAKNIIDSILKEMETSPRKRKKTDSMSETDQHMESDLLRSGISNVEKHMLVGHFKETAVTKELKENMNELSAIVLHGQGQQETQGILGSGKTQSALWYACQHRKSNPKSIVWKLVCTDNGEYHASLKHFLDQLQQQVDMQVQHTMESLSLKITSAAVKILSDTPGIHVIIFDNVTDRCTHIKKTVRIFADNTIQNIKCIITTQSKTLFSNENHVVRQEVKGFTEEESVGFLLQGKPKTYNERAQYYRELSEVLGFLPLGIVGARTYMNAASISPKRLLENIRKHPMKVERKLRVAEDHGSSEEISLFHAIKAYIEIVKEREGPVIYRFFQTLQFFNVKNIPLYFFRFLTLTEKSETEVDDILDSFVQTIRSFSLGTILNEDDERILNTHEAISLTIRMMTSTKERDELLTHVLKCCSWLLCKTLTYARDRKRNEDIYPHAKKALEVAEKVFPNPTIAQTLVMIFVCARISYAFRNKDIQKLAEEYSTKANDLCYEAIKIKKEEIDREVKKSFPESEMCSCICEKFVAECKERADIIGRKIDAKLESEDRDVIDDLIFEYILKKYRIHSHVEIFKRALHIEKLEKEIQLSEREFNQLCNLGMAVDKNNLTKQFIYELFISVFYMYGKRANKADTSNDCPRNCIQHLYIAKYLGQRFVTACDQITPLYFLLSERCGTIPLCYSSLFNGKQESTTTQPEARREAQLVALREAIKRLEHLMQDRTRYFSFGIFIMEGHTDNENKMKCSKHLIRCCMTLIQLSEMNMKKK